MSNELLVIICNRNGLEIVKSIDPKALEPFNLQAKPENTESIILSQKNMLIKISYLA